MPRMATRLALGASGRGPRVTVARISAGRQGRAAQAVVSSETTATDAAVAAVERLAAAL